MHLLEIKYQHGTNQWSGRGRKPDWVIEYEARGGDLQALKVTKPTYKAKTVNQSIEGFDKDFELQINGNLNRLVWLETLASRGYGQHYCLVTKKENLKAQKALVESLGYVVVDVCSTKSTKGQYVIFGDPLIAALLECQRDVEA